MAGFQRLIISLLVILTFTFVFFAQSSEAVKGPKITHKVLMSTFSPSRHVNCLHAIRSTSM